MALKLLIEDAELREALKQEGKEALTALGREEARRILEEVFESTLKKIVKEQVANILTPDSWVNSTARKAVVKESTDALVLIIREELAKSSLSEEGLVRLVKGIIGTEINQVVRKEFAALRDSLGTINLLAQALNATKE